MLRVDILEIADSSEIRRSYVRSIMCYSGTVQCDIPSMFHVYLYGFCCVCCFVTIIMSRDGHVVDVLYVVFPIVVFLEYSL